ncbi:glycoprotein-N-acetylgalactosamine 3-beta-galactosyltransferase 1-like [Macrobrachium nipponense]|uniref:glycoprotein-N-acetylgalactosamine 3-beta-galactosyltransferase 1-like n=1 Tax=Macrobrachium nipponense TaxID=159736 RepID=UPI0030C7CA37
MSTTIYHWINWGLMLLSYVASLSLSGVITGKIIKAIISPDSRLLFNQFHLRQHQSEDNPGNRIRILCWVLATSDKRVNALAAKKTWGKRCDKFVIVSDVADSDLGTVQVKSRLQNGKEVLWLKTRESFKYLFDIHLQDFDWFLKADVDTYIIVENLRYVLTLYDPDFPIALGERANVDGNSNYSFLSGGSGYALSRAALKIFGEVAYPDTNPCQARAIANEDVMMGHCMTKSGIMLGDTRDELERHRFYHNKPEDYIEGKWRKWFPSVMKYRYDKASSHKIKLWMNVKFTRSGKWGINSLSETTVSFHTLKNATSLYLLENLIYEVKVSSCD